MNDPLHVVCPHCQAVNRVPAAGSTSIRIAANVISHCSPAIPWS